MRQTGVASGPVTVGYVTRDASATSGQDYEPYSGKLRFSDGFQTVAVIVIQIRDDALAEGNETFQVVLDNPTGGASLAENSIATVTIVDNDALAISRTSKAQLER